MINNRLPPASVYIGRKRESNNESTFIGLKINIEPYLAVGKVRGHAHGMAPRNKRVIPNAHSPVFRYYYYLDIDYGAAEEIGFRS